MIPQLILCVCFTLVIISGQLKPQYLPKQSHCPRHCARTFCTFDSRVDRHPLLGNLSLAYGSLRRGVLSLHLSHKTIETKKRVCVWCLCVWCLCVWCLCVWCLCVWCLCEWCLCVCGLCVWCFCVWCLCVVSLCVMQFFSATVALKDDGLDLICMYA